MKEKTSNPFISIKPAKIIYPVIIGMGVVGYLLYKEFKIEDLKLLDFSWFTSLFLFVALGCMLCRDIGYMIRIRILSDKQLSWVQAFRIIMLWEFTSAITPSAVGGTSIAILFVAKEGISVGKSSAIVMATSLLDELYFIIMFPLLIFIVDASLLFQISSLTDGNYALTFANTFFYFAIIGYSLKFLWVLFIFYGLFFNPRGLKWLLMLIFRLPILRKWRFGAHQAGTEIITSSKELKSKSFKFWLKAFGATFMSWTARYWVVNALLAAFFIIPDQFMIFARQLVMWIMMLVSPTPGGSGFAEFVFTKYLGGLIPVSPLQIGGIAVAMALLWRLISYYPYLFIGAIILPVWLKNKFGKNSDIIE
jgi:hypothetical protein